MYYFWSNMSEGAMYRFWKEIRHILIGKTGSGKRSSGNKDRFGVGSGMESKTGACKWHSGTRNGTRVEEQMKGGNFHTTTFFKNLLLCELQASQRKMCNSRLAMIYPRTAEFRRVAECVDYFEQKITEGRKTMKDAVSRIFAELSINMSCALARPLLSVILFIMILMIRGCSTNPLPQASCTARHCVVGEPTAVTCLFGKYISASKLGVNVQMFPFNAPRNITGKDVLMCSWKKNTTTCFVAEGYSFNYNISDRLTLEIPVATPEIAGVYTCHFASEDSPPRACNLTVTEGSESTPTPTTTHATTGKETSNTTEPRRTLVLVIVVLISLCAILTVLQCFAIRTVLKLYKRLMPKIQNREAEDINTLLKDQGNAAANHLKDTKTDL